MKPILSHIIIHSLQKKILKSMGLKSVNSFEPLHEPGRRMTDLGELWVNDVRYGDTYPNSYCDIWFPDKDTKKKRPTIFYFHGGGFFFGSKTMGDPLAAKPAENERFISEFLREGFNLVNADYALTTDYIFPVPILQMNELFAFFLKHGEEYGISMDQVILMGGSAGADMSEIYGAAVNNPDYAKKLGFTPVLDETRIKALIIDESALSIDTFNFSMNVMFKTFMGTSNMKEEKAQLLDASKFIVRKYIPAFINSSNQEPWFLLRKKNMCSNINE